MRYAIKFAYDGTKFSGSQRQTHSNLKTVEGEIIDCLIKHKVITNTKSSKFQVASRTDAGVSALGNVLAINSNYKQEDILNILNSKMEYCWFYGIKVETDDFNPRHAKQRWYRYHLYNRTINAQKNSNISNNNQVNSEQNIDLTLLKSVTDQFQGRHDFRNYSNPSLDNTTRSIDSITLIENGDWIFIDLKAKSFLWHQVRRLVSSWISFASGKITNNDLENALDNPKIDYDFGLAPAEPLLLMDIKYDFEFEINMKSKKVIRKRITDNWQDILLKEKLFEYLLQKI